MIAHPRSAHLDRPGAVAAYLVVCLAWWCSRADLVRWSVSRLLPTTRDSANGQTWTITPTRGGQ